MITTTYNDALVEYKRKITAIVKVGNNYYRHNTTLKEITIERTGNSNKFFGFVVGQKATIKLDNKDNNIEITKGEKVTITFYPSNGTTQFPVFYVTDIKNDDTKKELVITANDLLTYPNSYSYSDLIIGGMRKAKDIISACATKLGANGVLYKNCNPDATNPPDRLFYNTSYPNFDGTETIRQVLESAAEATLTICYMNYENKIVFQRISSNIDLEVYANAYFTITEQEEKVLGAIVKVTELGDNLELNLENGGNEKQCVRDNSFWDNNSVIENTLINAKQIANEYRSNQLNCQWRGNYYLEIGDRVSFAKNDLTPINCYLINDTITYNGGFTQKTWWSFNSNTQPDSTNPVTITDALKQTKAKVDKVNSRIDLLVMQTDKNSESIASLVLENDSISARVETAQNIADNTANDIKTLRNEVEAKMTDTEVELLVKQEIAKGTNSVTTATGFTFNQDGLTVSKSNSEMTTTITEDGMTVKRSGTEVLTADNEGVKAEDLHATTYLIVGKNSRFEDYGNRTGCFWIGG